MPFGISWFWYQIIKVYLEGLLWIIIDMYNVYESKQNKKKKEEKIMFFFCRKSQVKINLLVVVFR